MEPNESEEVSFIEQKISNQPTHLPEAFLTSAQLSEIKVEPVIVLTKESSMENQVIKMEPNESDEVSFIEQKNSNDPTHLPEPFLTSDQLKEIKDEPVLVLSKKTTMENNPNIQFLTSEQLALKKEHHDKMKLLSELGNKVIQTAKASKASTSRNEYRRDTPMPVKEVLKLVENGINKLTQEHGKL